MSTNDSTDILSIQELIKKADAFLNSPDFYNNYSVVNKLIFIKDVTIRPEISLFTYDPDNNLYFNLTVNQKRLNVRMHENVFDIFYYHNLLFSTNAKSNRNVPYECSEEKYFLDSLKEELLYTLEDLPIVKEFYIKESAKLNIIIEHWESTNN